MIPGLLALSWTLRQVPPMTLPHGARAIDVGARCGRPRCRWRCSTSRSCCARRRPYGFMTFAPTLLTRQGLTIGEASTAVSLYLFASGIGGFFGGPLADRFGRAARDRLVADRGGAVHGAGAAAAAARASRRCWRSAACCCSRRCRSASPSRRRFVKGGAATVSSLMMGFAWGMGSLTVPLIGMGADRFGIERDAGRRWRSSRCSRPRWRGGCPNGARTTSSPKSMPLPLTRSRSRFPTPDPSIAWRSLRRLVFVRARRHHAGGQDPDHHERRRVRLNLIVRDGDDAAARPVAAGGVDFVEQLSRLWQPVPTCSSTHGRRRPHPVQHAGAVDVRHRARAHVGHAFFARYYFVTGIGAAVTSLLLSLVRRRASTTRRRSARRAPSTACCSPTAMYFPTPDDLSLFIFPIPARIVVMIVGAIAFLSSIGGPGGGVAHSAHLGGLVVGYLYLKGLRRAAAGRTRKYR